MAKEACSLVRGHSGGALASIWESEHSSAPHFVTLTKPLPPLSFNFLSYELGAPEERSRRLPIAAWLW